MIDKDIQLMLDFDGTISPIVDNPDDAEIHAKIENILWYYHDQKNIDIWVISGRSLRDVKDRVSMPNVSCVGNHGLQTDDEYLNEMIPDSIRNFESIKKAKNEVVMYTQNIDGLKVEDKDETFTVHYRNVEENSSRMRVVEIVTDIVNQIDGLKWREGKKCIEVLPDENWGKEDVVEILIDENPTKYPVYIGDDTTDLGAMEIASEYGTSISVGEYDESDYSVEGVDDVKDVLSNIEQYV